MARFQDKVVIVTGAGSGIGAAAARRFAAEGALVALAGRTEAGLRETASGLDPQRVLIHVLDVSNEAEVTRLIANTVDRFGRLDVLVNNAGIYIPGDIETVKPEDWRRVIATDLDSVYYASRAALPHLEKTHGNIINVSSVSGLGADWSSAAYNAAKGGVTNLTRAMALDLGKRGIRVNAVNPSLTITGMTRDIEKDREQMAKFLERMPLGRAAQPEDIAPVIAFLASDDARFVTGVNLPVDGGVTASNGQPAF